MAFIVLPSNNMKILSLLLCIVNFGVLAQPATDFTRWKTHTFKDMNISLQIPKGTVIDTDYDTTKNVKLGGDRELWLGLREFSDEDWPPACLINIDIISLDTNNTAKYLKGTAYFFTRFKEFYFNTNIISTNLTSKVFQVDGWGARSAQGKKDWLVQLRRDFVSKDGSVVLCGATIIASLDTFVYPTNDVKQVTRLINSISLIK